MIKAVIFDLDGTLVDTIEDLKDALNASLKQNGYNISYSRKQTMDLVGSGIRNLCKNAIENITCQEEDIDKVLSSFITNYDKMQINHSKPYEGVIELLDYIKQKNIKCAVFSNKKYENTVFNFYGVLTDFREIITKKGDRMAFVTISHYDTTISGVIWAREYKKLENLLKSKKKLFFFEKACGKIRNDKFQVVLTNIKELS